MMTVVLIVCMGTHGWAQTNLASESGEIRNMIPGDSGFEVEVTRSCIIPDGATPCILDDGEKYDGRQSLRLDFLAATWLSGVPCNLQTGKVYTFSLYARADKAGVSPTLYMIKTGWSHAYYPKQTNLLGKEWRRFSITTKSRGGDYFFGFGVSTQATVWVDAFQVEEGDKPTPYQNQNREFAKVGIEIPSEYNSVFFPNETVTARIRALDRHKSGESALLTWRVNDYYGRTIREGKEIKSFLNKEGYGREDIVMTGLNPGFYAVRAGLKIKGTNVNAISTFVVVNPPVEIEKGQMPFCGIIRSDSDHGPGRLGSKIIGTGWKWKDIEPTRGKYNWRGINSKNTNNHEKCLIKLYLAHLPSAPEWTWDKVEVADCEARKIKPENLLPSVEHLEDWRKFVRQLAERCKDKVDIIEVGAEDDLTFGGNPYYLAKYKEHVKKRVLTGGPAFERYAQMISIACHEIRQAAPNVKIGVIRPSGVDSDPSIQYTFSEAVLRQCGTNLEFDAFPLDCYVWPKSIGPGAHFSLPETHMGPALNRALDLCRKYGRGQPVYISEFGYKLDVTVPLDSEYTKQMVNMLARSYLVARMTKGVEFLDWFLQEGDNESGYDYGIWRAGLPLPSAAAYSAVARVVENVLESKEIPRENAIAVVFRKGNQADAAIWLMKGEGKIILNNPPKDLTITDVMGAPIAGDKTGDKTTLIIGEGPVYLSLQGSSWFTRFCDVLNLPGLNSFDRLCKILESADLRVTPLWMQLAEPRADKGIVILHNQTEQDLKAKVICTVRNVSATNEVLVAKGGKTETTFDLPSAFAEHGEKIRVEADCGAGFEKVAESFPAGGYMVCKRISAPITVDGDCGKWRGRAGIMMNNRGQIWPPDPRVAWDGTNDLSAVVWTGWDQTNFYFAAEVRDDLHFNGKTGLDIWNGDGFQIAFTPLAVSDLGLVGTSSYGPNDTEIGLALAQEKPEGVQLAGPGKVWQNGKYMVKRDEANKTTRYEAAIPWVALGILPKPGKIFGFNFVLFDDDTGAGQSYYYQLSPGIANGKNPALFKRFVMME